MFIYFIVANLFNIIDISELIIIKQMYSFFCYFNYYQAVTPGHLYGYMPFLLNVLLKLNRSFYKQQKQAIFCMFLKVN